MKNKVFEGICRLTQEGVKRYSAIKLRETHSKVIEGDGYVYAQGELPILLVAHMDTVHAASPKKFIYDDLDASVSSPTGIGGDDRCGIYMVLEIVRYYNCSVLFCEDEEIGGIGAEKFCKSKTAKGLEFNYMLEFDRKGSTDAVFYNCDNEEFEDFITDKFFKTAWGTFSDISILAPWFKCAAVNLSCGYYQAHTKTEYVVLPQMAESIKAACEIIAKTKADDKFEYIEAKYSYGGYGGYDYGYGSGWNDDDSDMYGGRFYYMIQYMEDSGKTSWYDVFANSEAEAIGKFLIEQSDLTFSHIIDVCKETF